jgi:hypothetical protein
MLENSGYKVGNTAYVQEGADGTVSRTEPAAGTSLRPGETVMLYVNGTHPATATRSVPLVRILGVDPGLRVTGYGAIECAAGTMRLVEAGTIAPDVRAPLERRLGELHAEVCAVLDATVPE